MSYEIRNPEIERLLKELGIKIRKDMPRGFGFTLFIFGYGEDKPLFYISSAVREDMIKTMYEFIEKLQETK